MYTVGLAVASVLALTASAVPHASQHQHKHRSISSRDTNNFALHVHNQCQDTQTFAVYQITSDYQVQQQSASATINPGESNTIMAPFYETGLRLATDASISDTQALFEFGYSTYAGNEGTAYDISVMGGDIGVAVYPRDRACASKYCTPTNCALSQGWTSAAQVNDGSPADTTCYEGKTDFKVVFCPGPDSNN